MKFKYLKRTATQKVIDYVTKLQEPGKTANQISRAIKVDESFVKRCLKCLAAFKYIDNTDMFRFFAIDNDLFVVSTLSKTFSLPQHEHTLLCMKLEKVGLTYNELDSDCKPTFKFIDMTYKEVNDCKCDVVWQRRLVNDSIAILNLVNESNEQRWFACYDNDKVLAVCKID